MKATEQYFLVVLFIMLYKVVLTFEFVDEILKSDYSNESYRAVPSCGLIILYKVVLTSEIISLAPPYPFLFLKAASKVFVIAI